MCIRDSHAQLMKGIMREDDCHELAAMVPREDIYDYLAEGIQHATQSYVFMQGKNPKAILGYYSPSMLSEAISPWAVWAKDVPPRAHRRVMKMTTRHLAGEFKSLWNLTRRDSKRIHRFLRYLGFLVSDETECISPMGIEMLRYEFVKW